MRGEGRGGEGGEQVAKNKTERTEGEDRKLLNKTGRPSTGRRGDIG